MFFFFCDLRFLELEVTCIFICQLYGLERLMVEA